MRIQTSELKHAASRLHAYILKTHWNGEAISGPDSGVRLEFRVGRFVKNYLDFIPWSDDYVFFQAQGYWIRSNWLMAELLEHEEGRNLALACSEYVVSTQRPEGYWEYPPLPSRRGRIATVEGNIAAIGLVESYRRERQPHLLAAVEKWYKFLTQNIGFQESETGLAINYWAHASAGKVPNNTTLTLWALAELSEVVNDDQYLTSREAMISFLNRAQMSSGELPYIVKDSRTEGRPHFLCYQYNAFECLDLAHYYRMTGDKAVLPILKKLAAFLSTGITELGAARYDCHKEKPEVIYYTAALGAALGQATALGLGDYHTLIDRAFRRVLSQQRKDGGVEFFSKGNYGLLADRRSYPRNLSMILYHLLLEVMNRSGCAEYGSFS